MADWLAAWWQHSVLVERATGNEAYGRTYDPPVTVTGFFSDRTELAGGPNGSQVASAGKFAFPSSVAYIPPGSRLTLPGTFGSRVVTVVASSVGDAGAQPTPNHQEVDVT